MLGFEFMTFTCALLPNRHKMEPFQYTLNNGFLPALEERNQKGKKIMWIWNGSWNSNHTLEASSCCSSLSPDASQRTHTPAFTWMCVWVCVIILASYTNTFLSCMFDSTLSPDRTCRLFRVLPGTVVPTVQLLHLIHESVQLVSTGNTWCDMFMCDLLHYTADIGFHLNAQKCSLTRLTEHETNIII